LLLSLFSLSLTPLGGILTRLDLPSTSNLLVQLLDACFNHLTGIVEIGTMSDNMRE